MSIDLRCYTYLDVLQPQLAGYLGTRAQGYLPQEGQAALLVEIAPGIEINRVTDVAIKHAEVEPGWQVVERAFGMLELHSFKQDQVREAGQAILRMLDCRLEDRRKPKVVNIERLTGIEPYQAMLINRMRQGQMILRGETLLILETDPAGYALIAANEAEKAAPIKLLDVQPFGAFGRLYLSGDESSTEEAGKAVQAVLSGISGRER